MAKIKLNKAQRILINPYDYYFYLWIKFYKGTIETIIHHSLAMASHLTMGDFHLISRIVTLLC